MQRISTNLCIPVTLVAFFFSLAISPAEEAIESGHFYLTACIPDEKITSPLVISYSGKSINHPLNLRNIGDQIRVPNDKVFSVSIQTIKDEEKQNHTVEVKIPASYKRSIVVIHTPIDVDDDSLTYSVIDVSQFSGGSAFYLNLWKNPLQVTVDKTDLDIEPGELRVFTMSQEKSYSPLFQLRQKLQGDQDWKDITSSKVVFSRTRNELVIFFDNKGNFDFRGVVMPVAK